MDTGVSNFLLPQSPAKSNCSFAGPYDHNIPEQQQSMMQIRLLSWDTLLI